MELAADEEPEEDFNTLEGLSRIGHATIQSAVSSLRPHLRAALLTARLRSRSRAADVESSHHHGEVPQVRHQSGTARRAAAAACVRACVRASVSRFRADHCVSRVCRSARTDASTCSRSVRAPASFTASAASRQVGHCTATSRFALTETPTPCAALHHHATRRVADIPRESGVGSRFHPGRIAPASGRLAPWHPAAPMECTRCLSLSPPRCPRGSRLRSPTRLAVRCARSAEPEPLPSARRERGVGSLPPGSAQSAQHAWLARTRGHRLHSDG